MVPWNSASGGFAYNWQSKWVGIIAIKTERTQIHFLSDVLVAVASLDLKVPIKLTRMHWKNVSNAVLPRSWVNFSIFWASISSNRLTYSVKLHTDHQLKKNTKKKSNNNSNIESIWWTNNTKDRKTTQITGIYHLHEKTTNYGWKLKRFVAFRMVNFRKNKLRFEGMQFPYTV